MTRDEIEIEGFRLPLYSVNTLVIGSGAAALNAAVNVFAMGQEDIAIVTERWGGGTSNNAGSDKQTYYKLSLSGSVADSPLTMAKDLYRGGCMHGDIALCEAANSLQAFFHLVQLGVPFPRDRYGCFTGYRTDNDPRGRATSAGPLTSQLMWKALAQDVLNKGIPLLDSHQVIALLADEEKEEKHVTGALAIDRSKIDNASGHEKISFVVFNAVNVVLGTGGPAGMYRRSVYPESQTGATGMAFEIGAAGNNLTESQYGIASTAFRWNLSGTYQQVIPRYLSTDKNGKDEREFLNRHFPDMGRLASAIFLKGYQWPFDSEKLMNHGSSLIDLLVWRETAVRGRRAFLDYRSNPTGEGGLAPFSFDMLDEEAYRYLENSKALSGTPIERLKRMNQPAVDLYRDNGIDLERDRLEIDVCAQHNNGGLRGNLWWESNITHLFPVGEANGTHGIRRPGGASLNSGQVGGFRAAQFITRRYTEPPPPVERFLTGVRKQIAGRLEFAKRLLDGGSGGTLTPAEAHEEIRTRMAACGSFIRDPGRIAKEIPAAWNLYRTMKRDFAAASPEDVPDAFRVLDLCLTHAVYLDAMGEYLEKGGRSRGSFVVPDPKGEKPCDSLEDRWRFSRNRKGAYVDRAILEIQYDDSRGETVTRWIDIRPVPEEDGWFERVWKENMNDEIIR
jgi:succinate dehydrogenase/fumarate reductase flavoprotein subunit